MKIQILKENCVHDGGQYTRIQYSNGKYMWYYGFDNKCNSSLDEVGYGSGREFNKLELEYQKEIKRYENIHVTDHAINQLNKSKTS